MKTVLITGANRGLGLEFVKQLSDQGVMVYASCREPSSAHELHQLAEAKSTIQIETLDVTSDASIAALATKLKEVTLDGLINNAGTSGQRGVTIGNIERENFLNVMEINCLSVLKVSEAFLPLLEKSNDKLITVVSSAMGSISDNNSGGSFAYRASKSALNCAMRSFAIDVKEQGIKVLLLHPGWVRTRMGGDNAQVEPADSVRGMLGQITEHKATSHADVLRRFDGGTLDF